MRKKIVPITLIIIGLFVSVQFLNAQEKTKTTSERSFNVELEKSNFAMLEPILATFKYNILSTDAVPRVLQDSSIRITFKGVTKEFNRLTQSVVSARPQRLPGEGATVKLEYYEEEGIINRSKEFFPEPGTYQLQFCLYDAKSAVIELTIEEPANIDREAIDFLNQHEGDVSFSWVWEEKNGIDFLKEFVDKYGQSVYGKYAIQYLGNIYLIKGNLEKAQIEFEKIKNSSNKYIAESANKSLLEIKQKRLTDGTRRKNPLTSKIN